MERDEADIGLIQGSYASAARRHRLRSSVTDYCGLVAIAIAVAFGTAFMIALLLLLTVGSIVLNGLLLQLTGHAILRALKLDGYEFPLRAAMQIGATGGAILWPAVTFMNSLLGCCFSPQQGTRHRQSVSYPTLIFQNIFDLCWTTAFGAAAGVVGSKVLINYGHEVMDPLHAARAGALGGAVLGPGIIIGLTIACFTMQLIIGVVIKILPCECGCWNSRAINEPGTSLNWSYRLIFASSTFPFAANRAAAPQEVPMESHNSQHAAWTSQTSRA